MTKGERFAEQVVRRETVNRSGTDVPCVAIGWFGPASRGETVYQFILPIPDDLDPAVAIADIRKSVAEAYDLSLIY